jgi:cob(I)alamin adenosyltransferase
MKIYTKQGDQGKTSLIGGRKVPKNDIKIESYGTVDELNSWVGLLRDQSISQVYIDQLLEVQDRLFTAGSLLAAEDGHKMQLPQLSDSDVTFLEESIDSMNEKLPEMRSFVLPGGHSTVSYCHVARCVCRRAERLCVALNQVEEKYGLIVQYLNRLSDYLFVLSRALTADLNAKEMPWKPRV